MTRKFGTVLLLGLVALGSCSENEVQRHTDTVKVKAETARFTNSEAETVYVGQVEAQTTTAASFTGMGSIERICVTEGQRVNKGQLIAIMNSETAKSALDAAKAQMQRANDAYTRMKQLYDNGSLPEIKWVEVESNVAMAKSQMELAEKQARDCRLLAPASGIVGKGIKQAGETAVPASPVMNILDIDRVKIKIAIPEKDYSSLTSPKQTVIKVGAIGEETFASYRIERGVEGNPMTHTYDVYLYVDNAGHKLLPGMVANVTCVPTDSNFVLTLPLRAVRKNSNGNFVWIVKNGKAHIQPVTTGKIIGNRIEIESGLGKSELVITDGYQKLDEGTSVSL